MADLNRGRVSDAKQGGAPRKSNGSVSAGSTIAPQAKSKVKEDGASSAVESSALPEGSTDPSGKVDATSPESSLSISSSAPRAQKRKKRDDGSSVAFDTESISSSSIRPNDGAGTTPEDLEKRVRELQLEDRIHHLEMLLVQSMNRNEQMQAHFTRSQPALPIGDAHPFSTQSTSAFNAATLASAGIPAAACAYSEAQNKAAAGSSTTMPGSMASNSNMPHQFDAATVFSGSTGTPSHLEAPDHMFSPTSNMGGTVGQSSLMGSTSNPFVANAGLNALPGGVPIGLHPNALPLLAQNRVQQEINAQPQADANIPPPDPFLELLWPGWPVDLPSPDTVHHLAEIFFSKCPIRNMLNKGNFMAALSLPPRHPDRPHPALLHAMLAVAAPMSPHFKSKRSNPLANGVLSPNGRPQTVDLSTDPAFVVPMVGDPTRRIQTVDPSKLSFADFHLSQARLKIEQSMRTSTKNPIDWLQACIMGTYLLWADGRFVEGFMLSGVLSRSAAPVGLFKLQSRHTAEPQIPASLLAPPSSASEEHERRALMWYVYLNDVYQSGAGLYWEPIIEDAAIQTSLPVPMMQWQAGLDPPPNHQTLSSPDLFTSNHMDDFILHIKSAVILKRVQMFISRNNITMFTTKRPPSFRQLDNIINEFLASFTGSHHLEFGPDVTMDRLIAYCNVLLATILLHENFVSVTDRTSYHNVRTEQATKAILQTIYELLASSFDFNLLHPYIYMSWTIAARMICRELTWQRIFGDANTANEVSQALDTVIEALRRGGDKHIVAARSALLLDRFRQGHWSEEMLSGSIFIDGILPGDEDDGLEQSKSARNSAPTKPGQPVHYYPLVSGKRHAPHASSQGNRGSQTEAGSSMGGGSSGANQPAFDISQMASAAAAAFANWMPDLNDAMRSTADPFIAGSRTGGAVNTPGSTGIAATSSDTSGLGTGGESSVHVSSGSGAASGATGPHNGNGMPSDSASLGVPGNPSAGGSSSMSGLMHTGMQVSPAPTAPSTPWSLMNILAPEQEGLD
ncbi:hypothetical protein OC846_005494 [Tilletia horrida]|uniref:Transcription factor domain-containing protein n=1 Tax=Tilletia horrida TaxID=155126 RepID=A0AAN6GL60_9BASI|nr:hypothetical protein OC846_005494 [Tilletia horrida]KAK0551541.1 hypothetical protein OC845_002121 [Tilletia horrida]KAK0569526.1 hypothetical protein OC861_000899 [Tilletia horrida]